MGTSGMRYSLQSREIIADSIETVTQGQWYDANISLVHTSLYKLMKPGCDKNMPGCLIAMGRFNRPSIMVYGGTIRAGCAVTQNNAPIDIISAFQAYGEYITKTIDEKTRFDVIRHACPGAGACGGMYTANTMASAAEAMGMTLPGSSSTPAESEEKLHECLNAGAAIRNLLEKDIKPRDIMTAAAFRNAIVLTMALGGSTNAVLHLIAIARAVDVPLRIDDFQEISDQIPFIADMKPSGKYVMEDLHRVGGTQAVLKYLLSKGLIDGSTMTVTGKTLEENLSKAPDLHKNQDVIRPLEKPIKPTGHITILRGTLAPGGSVGKITGKEGTEFTGTAKVYDAEDLFIQALERGEIKKGEKTVVVIRYEGPRGGPGMPGTILPIKYLIPRNAETILCSNGRWLRTRCRFINRRTFLWWFTWIPHRSHRPRSARRWSDRPRPRWR